MPGSYLPHANALAMELAPFVTDPPTEKQMLHGLKHALKAVTATAALVEDGEQDPRDPAYREWCRLIEPIHAAAVRQRAGHALTAQDGAAFILAAILLMDHSQHQSTPFGDAPSREGTHD